MGRHINKNLSNIYLVQDEEEAQILEVEKPDNLAIVTQTTLSVDDTKSIIEALKVRFPSINIAKKDDICYATQNRQDAVKELAGQCELILVVGSPNSSNSNRLKELASRLGVRSFLIDDESEIVEEWFKDIQTVGITSGASAPESLVEQVVARLKCIEPSVVENIVTREETMEFSLPKELRS